MLLKYLKGVPTQQLACNKRQELVKLSITELRIAVTNGSRRSSRRSRPPLTPLSLHVDEDFQTLVLLDTQTERIRADAILALRLRVQLPE